MWNLFDFKITFLVILVICEFSWTKQTVSENLNKCRSKLLDDVIKVPDSAFTSSSYFHSSAKGGRQLDFSPKAARESYDKINLEFAWCPKHQITMETKEYLQIDLGRLVVMNIISTKGRFDQGAGKEFTPYFKVSYKRNINDHWKNYTKFEPSKGRVTVLDGPTDTFLDAFVKLEPPIVARYIRVYPYSYDMRRVCMKLQIFGCDFLNNLIEYRAPIGSIYKDSSLPIYLPNLLPSVITLFRDSSYDGTSSEWLTTGGLGRIADESIGCDFIKNINCAVKYVGWNRNQIGGDRRDSKADAISIIFYFENVRRFHKIKIYGYHGKIASLPEHIEAKFSIDGITYHTKDFIEVQKPVRSNYSLSPISDCWVEFSLNQMLGRTLQLSLFYSKLQQTTWILISEVTFTSDEVPPHLIPEHISTKSVEVSSSIHHTKSTNNNNINNQSEANSINIVYMLIILLCLLIVVICAISLYWVIMRRRKHHQRKKDIIKKHELGLYSPPNPFKPLSRQFYSTNRASVGIGSYPIVNTYYTPATLQMTRKDNHLLNRDSPHQINGMTSTSNQYTFPQLNNSNSLTKSQLAAMSQNNSNNNEAGSIYTSILGSDNDSTDYGGSCTTSSHHYTPTMPGPQHPLLIASHLDYGGGANGQPQIIGNPFVDYPNNTNSLDPHLHQTFLVPYEPDVVAMTAASPLRHPYNSNHMQHHPHTLDTNNKSIFTNYPIN